MKFHMSNLSHIMKKTRCNNLLSILDPQHLIKGNSNLLILIILKIIENQNYLILIQKKIKN